MLSRRDLLKSLLTSSAKLAVASSTVYVVGAAFKGLDGRLTAGAKQYECDGDAINTGCSYGGTPCHAGSPVITCQGGYCWCQ